MATAVLLLIQLFPARHFSCDTFVCFCFCCKLLLLLLMMMYCVIRIFIGARGTQPPSGVQVGFNNLRSITLLYHRLPVIVPLFDYFMIILLLLLCYHLHTRYL